MLLPRLPLRVLRGPLRGAFSLGAARRENLSTQAQPFEVLG
jgi:hypothetical protein